MTLPVQAKDLAVGDWSDNYGTITEIQENKNRNQDILSYDISFFNGQKLNSVKPEFEIFVVQGGADIVHNGMPDLSQIRPGLKADHAQD